MGIWARKFHARTPTPTQTLRKRPPPPTNTEENEDRYGASGLERLLTRAVLSAPGVKQIHVNPVTDGNLMVVLWLARGGEGVPLCVFMCIYVYVCIQRYGWAMCVYICPCTQRSHRPPPPFFLVLIPTTQPNPIPSHQPKPNTNTNTNQRAPSQHAARAGADRGFRGGPRFERGH
jgi:hypothetical protein